METGRVKASRQLISSEAIAIFTTALVGALIFISVLGHQDFQVEALRVQLGVKPALTGTTVVEIPPLAVIRAHTHTTPLRLTIRLESIDPQSVQKMLGKRQNSAGLLSAYTGGLRSAAALFTLKILLLAAAGGAFGVFVWRRQPGICHLQGTLAATLTVGALLAATYLSYDAGRFKKPEYDGALKVAPWAISLAGEALDKIDTLGSKMEMVADNVHKLFSQIDRLQPFGEEQGGLVKILHVSDIHNNPAALVYIQRIAGLFNVDLIIDTGDITDYGTPLESILLERLAGINVPYVFIPGNHDSPETVKKMRSIPGVRVLDGNSANIKSLRITGFADPASKSAGIEPPSEAAIPLLVEKVKSNLEGTPEKPDILAVHNHRIARDLAGTAPVILHGHDHRLSVGESKGSVLIDAGSSGAAGLRRLQGDRTPYSVVIQYYAPAGGEMRLVAADAITLKDLGSGFHLDRHVFEENP